LIDFVSCSNRPQFRGIGNELSRFRGVELQRIRGVENDLPRFCGVGNETEYFISWKTKEKESSLFASVSPKLLG
jgi:hypothetical protein